MEMFATTVEYMRPILIDVLEVLATVAFIWLPLVFAGFAFGRKRVGLRFFFVLLTVEAAAIASAIHLQPDIFSAKLFNPHSRTRIIENPNNFEV